MKELAARLIRPFVRVRSKIVPLRLQEIRGEPLSTVAIIVRQGGHECRAGHTSRSRGSDHMAPVGLRRIDFTLEVWV